MTPAEFIVAFPPFKDEDPADIQRQIDVAVLFLDQGRWGAQYDYGLGLYTAHLIVMEKAAGANGGLSLSVTPAIRKQVGSVSVEYSARILEQQATDDLMRTSYGQRYRYLARQVGMGALAV